MIPSINLSDYTYDLPDERIARFPVEPRDSSKLLVYKNAEISKKAFTELPDLLPEKSFLVFNNTKVIPARLFFQKKTKSIIEVFLLNPVLPTNIISQVMETTATCTWACMIGNKKRWKGEVLSVECRVMNDEFGEEITFIILAELVDSEQNLVKFAWKLSNPNNQENLTNQANHGLTFAEIVKSFGEIPLPPYLKRKTEAKDLETYQTIYSKQDGAVAAPTAGLHFTEQVFEDLVAKNIQHDFLTLHVGAGTFQPIKVTNIVEHRMHSEQILFTKSLIIKLLENINNIIPVGTTSMRSLESLYWFGVKLLENCQPERSRRQDSEVFFIEKLCPYENLASRISHLTSLNAILDFMQKNNLEELIGETEIFIFPGYEFRLCKGIITNFHQPDSTLILLVAALVGEDWRKIYDFALENEFRFLSYGDSSLLLKSHN